MILGITGGSGCGKTTALMAIRDMGGLVLDCDEIYHGLLRASPALLAAIEARFPGVVEDGRLNRKKLGSIVFQDEKALLDLNRISHGAVKEAVLARLRAHRGPLAAIDAIALFEGGLAALCDYTIAVTAPRAVRVARLMLREGITREYAESRLNAQRDDTYFHTLCDFTLENTATREEFYKKTKLLVQKLQDRDFQKTKFKEDYYE